MDNLSADPLDDVPSLSVVWQTKDAKAPFLAPLPPQIFIGQEQLMVNLKARILDADRSGVIVLGGLLGVGKTTLAAQLAHDSAIVNHFHDGVLWAGLGQKPNLSLALDQWALALGVSADDVVNAVDMAACVTAVRRQLAPRRALLIIDDAWTADDVRTLLVGGPQCLHLVTTRRPDLITALPEAEFFPVRELTDDDGLKLLEQLAPLAVKTERQQAQELAQLVGGLPLALVLMGKYLWQKSHSGQRRRIRQAINELRNAEQRLRLEMGQSMLSLTSGVLPDAPLSLIASIRVSEEALDVNGRSALRALAIHHPKPKRFSAEFAASMGVAAAGLQNLISSGLLETASRRDPAQAAYLGEWVTAIQLDKESGPLYQMPPVVSDYARMEMTPAQKFERRRRTAVYYAGWLRNFEETQSDATPYLRQFRYSSLTWQEAIGEWLSQLDELDKNDQAASILPTNLELAPLINTAEADYQNQADFRLYAKLEFARLYFDAFWWWGCYCDFPFCNQLLKKWRETRTKLEDQQWLQHMARFHDAYPTGYEKRGHGDWTAVEEALTALRQIGGIDDEQFAAQRQHLHAITNIFLAESRRFRDVTDPTAERYYLEALAMLQASAIHDDEDAWNVPWVLWHLGDLYLEQGRYDEALEQITSSRQLAVAGGDGLCEQDNEILANAYRVAADVCWQRGEVTQAFQNYKWALFYSFMLTGCPILPNFYTATFYGEMMSRTLDRLHALWLDQQQFVALTAVRNLHEFWRPFWVANQDVETAMPHDDPFADTRSDQLRAYLFPPSPTEEDMKDPARSAAYADRVRQFGQRMIPAIQSEADAP